MQLRRYLRKLWTCCLLQWNYFRPSPRILELDDHHLFQKRYACSNLWQYNKHVEARLVMKEHFKIIGDFSTHLWSLSIALPNLQRMTMIIQARAVKL